MHSDLRYTLYSYPYVKFVYSAQFFNDFFTLFICQDIDLSLYLLPLVLLIEEVTRRRLGEVCCYGDVTISVIYIL